MRIPAFQREFVWKDNQIIDLLSSVRDHFPIGSILLWYVDRKMMEIASHQLTAFPDVPESYPTNYILDGMQRLSTLYGTFHFQAGQCESFNVYYDLRGRRFIHQRDLVADEINSAIPLSALISPRSLLEHQARLARMNDGDALLDELLRTQAAFQDYMVPVVRIQGNDIDRIVGIFERTNSTGTRLDTIDFMRAITWNQSFDLNHYLDLVREPLQVTGFELSDETIIKCVGLLLGVSPSGEGLLSLRNRSPGELRDAFLSFPDKFNAVREFLRQGFGIQNIAFVPYEGQLLVLFKTIGMSEAKSPIELDQIKRWFWAVGFNESLRGKPDHYVVRAVSDWRALINGQIRGLETRLRLSKDDFFERRLIRGKALSGAFAAMFAIHEAKSLMTGEKINSSEFMATSDLRAFESILTGKELKESGLDVGPSPRIFPNVLLRSLADLDHPGPVDWRSHILKLGEEGRVDVLISQFIDKDSIAALDSGSYDEFLRRRAELLHAKAYTLVGA